MFDTGDHSRSFMECHQDIILFQRILEMSDFQPTSTESATLTPASRRNKADADNFTGALAPVQLRLPADMISSLRLMSIQTGRSMSDLAMECLTTDSTVPKSWITSRRSAG
jgi:hypothetical protein